MKANIRKIPASVQSELKLPASKSISNRLLIISALSGNKIKIENLSDSDDTKTMVELLNSDKAIRDAGHAGTTMRFLTAFFAISDEEVILTGTERMKNRPIGELVDRLKELGAQIEYLEKQGYPPLRIRGKKLKGGSIRINSSISSQYISALMMIGPYLKGGLEILLEGETMSYSYINMTLSLMNEAGAEADIRDNLIRIIEKPYSPGKIVNEPDWSSASYWYMIAGLHGNAEILLKGLGRNSFQGDSQIAAIFDSLGVNSRYEPKGIVLSGKDLKMKEFHYDFRNNPDMVQSFAPYCIGRNIPFYFSGCRSLRIKETDRVEALHTELKKFGAEISFSSDGDLIWWEGKSQPDWNRQPTISTYKDHRMALGMTPLAIKTGGLTIEDPDVVSKSYPSFWDDLEMVGFGIER